MTRSTNAPHNGQPLSNPDEYINQVSFAAVWDAMLPYVPTTCCAPLLCLFRHTGEPAENVRSVVRWTTTMLDIITNGTEDERVTFLSCHEYVHICCLYEGVRKQKIRSLILKGRDLLRPRSGQNYSPHQIRYYLRSEWYDKDLPMLCLCCEGGTNRSIPDGFLNKATELLPTVREVVSVLHSLNFNASHSEIRSVVIRMY